MVFRNKDKPVLETREIAARVEPDDYSDMPNSPFPCKNKRLFFYCVNI